ncbi:MAG: riboflavin synthase [Lentisphaeria bacterium]|nr:riboflavin synthase [Lentisphaeria bacterium]
MFTGLVEQTGVIVRMYAGRITVRPERPFEKTEIGESIAVNGCCLTAERFFDDGSVEFFTLAETLRRTNLGAIGTGGKVNLERAMSAGGRMGGHIVQGHVDAAARVRSMERLADGDIEFAVELPPELAPEIAMKGSITIDGVSLTVAGLGEDYFSVRLIPQTLNATALKERHPGEMVNLETDIIAKYLRRQLSLISPAEKRKPTWNDLQGAGIL